MKSILYIGNKLNHKKSNLSSISTLGPLLESEGFKLYYASSKINKYFRLFEMLYFCLKYSRKVDFVIIDTYSTDNFYYALLVSQLCRILKIRYIPSLNGGNLPKRLKQNPKLSNYIFNNSYKNVSPSLYLKYEFEKKGYKNINYIPNTIELSKYKFKERNFDTVKLLWVRSFSKIYNPSLAIKIAKRLLDKNVKVKLCMVGPDSDGTLKEVKSLARHLGVDVKFTGKLTKPKWIELSKEYNIFINTTNFDNMPVSVIEAMALGLIVVSTNVGGMPNLIEHQHDGILVEPNNEILFADAIINLINSPKSYNEIVLNARAKVEQFDWEVIKHIWFKVLQ